VKDFWRSPRRDRRSIAIALCNEDRNAGIRKRQTRISNLFRHEPLSTLRNMMNTRPKNSKFCRLDSRQTRFTTRQTRTTTRQFHFTQRQTRFTIVQTRTHSRQVSFTVLQFQPTYLGIVNYLIERLVTKLFRVCIPQRLYREEEMLESKRPRP
jgi:hypothetical protein